MNQKVVREQAKKYLLIATVTEGKKGGKSAGLSRSSCFTGGSSSVSEMSVLHAKMLKNMDRRLNTLTSKVEKTLKDISDRIDTVSSNQRNE